MIAMIVCTPRSAERLQGIKTVALLPPDAATGSGLAALVSARIAPCFFPSHRDCLPI